MVVDFEEFCIWMYVLVDDFWQQVPAAAKPQRGPRPACSDRELLTLLLVGECLGWDQETELLAHWQRHRDLFPHLPSRSRLNRRRRALALGLNWLRRLVLRHLDLAGDRQCVIDGLPLPVVKLPYVPGASREWAAHAAAYGYVHPTQAPIYGYKLHGLLTLTGVIRDFVLVPANTPDTAAAADLLELQTDLAVLGDKGYRSAPLQAELAERQGVHLQALTRRNETARELPAMRRLLRHFRQIIETVHAQLSEQFHIKENHAHSFWGLCARLYTKLTAHTLCVYLNRLLGETSWLHIKRLAFVVPEN